MNRNELLTKLAMEMPEWPEKSRPSKILPDPPMWSWVSDGCDVFLLSADGKHQIRKEHWLDRRTELINEPDDADAPEWAKWKAQDADGEWFWFESEPYIDDEAGWGNYLEQGGFQFASYGKIPAGHDWKQTLKEVDHMTTTAHEDQYAPEPRIAFEVSTPEEEAEFQRIEAERALSDGQLTHDMGKQARYQDFNGEDWIDEFARTATLDEFRGAMRFTIGKYNRRMGRKDDVLSEVRKMADYCRRWEAYELTNGDKP